MRFGNERGFASLCEKNFDSEIDRILIFNHIVFILDYLYISF